MPARKLWLPLAATQFIDNHVIWARDYQAETAFNASSCKFGPEKLIELRLGKNEQAIEDFYFFLNKGIRVEYLKRIFEDLHRYDAKNVPSVTDGSTAKKSIGRNSYTAAKQDNIYDHTISTAKKVYALKGNHLSVRNDAALLVLLHDMGKIKNLMRDLKIPLSQSHDARSAKYASLVITEKEDKKKLEYIHDWLANIDLDRKYKSNTCGRILEQVDYADRKENQERVENKSRAKS